VLIRFSLILHLLFSFYMQGNKELLKTTFSIKEFLKHEFKDGKLFYIVTIILISVMFDGGTFFSYLIIVVLLIAYRLVSYIKKTINCYEDKLAKEVFIVDNIIRLFILFLIVVFIENSFEPAFFIDYGYVFLNYLLAFLLISKPANVIFNIFFDKFKPNDKSDEDAGYDNAGAMIGIMERMLIIICILSGNFSTIGFVIGVKSIARFGKLSKTKFGEYFLLGTLYSLLYTIAVYFLIFVMHLLY